MPTGAEETASVIIGGAITLLQQGVQLSIVSNFPDAAGYADFQAWQSCNPVVDHEQFEGSYADPGGCVCYEDSGMDLDASSDESVDPAPQPTSGDKPSSSPPPARSQGDRPSTSAQLRAGSDPTVDERKEPIIPPALTGDEPLVVWDTKYFTLSLSLDPSRRPELPAVPSIPVDASLDVKLERVIEDLSGLQPAEDAPELPGDEARQNMTANQSTGDKIIKAVADAVGLGGVAEGVSDITLLMAEDEVGLTAEQQAELERRLAVKGLTLVLEVMKAGARGRAGKKGPGKPKLPTVTQYKNKLKIYKENIGRHDKDVEGVTRWREKPDKPPSLSRTGDEVTGVWNENGNIKVKVKTGADNPTGVKEVELEISKVQKAKPADKEHTARYRRAVRETGFIPKGKDAGHVAPRSIMDFEDVANYSPEFPQFNRQLKYKHAEAKVRQQIAKSGGKDDLTLKIAQEYSEGPGHEYVTKSRHVLTRTSDGKDLIYVEIDALTGKVTDRSPRVP